MPQQISHDLFSKTFFTLLQETFEKVEGIYLDKGTSLLETVAAITAAEASRPIAPNGTTIAGHVDHIRFYLRVLNDYMDGNWHQNLDWKQSWLTAKVTESEWDALRKDLEADYQHLLTHLKSFTDWNDNHRLGGAMGIIVHTAYHLGAIRQIIHAARRK